MLRMIGGSGLGWYDLFIMEKDFNKLYVELRWNKIVWMEVSE